MSLRNFNQDSDGCVQVYVDGACFNNGQDNARAGIGVWFSDDNPRNVSERIKGRQTNNEAEIQAATRAILQAESAGIRKLRVYTDSEFLIKCATVWMKDWKRNNWMKANNKPVENQASLIKLDEACSRIHVEWKHVEGHAGVPGNVKADAFAKQGAQM